VSTQFPAVDPEGLLEFSVVFTDRSLNHMSKAFQSVMLDIGATLRRVYGADGVIVVPGGGTYGMEAVARQLGTDAKCMVLRNGWFSYRWTQIFETGAIPGETFVLKARAASADPKAPFAPAPIEEVVAAIEREKPDVFFAPHVETSSGIILPDAYIKAIGDAVRGVGGLFVLDCIASGTVWVDMKALGVNVLISAPQKGWSASPCSALVMIDDRARARIDATTSTSFACDLKKWMQIMQAYENGGHAYHATMPTDALTRFRDAMLETEERGLEALRTRQLELGQRVRALLAERGFPSVAAPGFEAPGVVVVYTDDALLQNGRKFIDVGLQTAAGVPLMCDEPKEFRTFRVGLFGLDKLADVDATVQRLEHALDRVTALG
jgi:aspartate aminotransferase-like enzyme